MTEQRLIRTFGRIKSRRLSDHKNHLLQNLLPQYQLQADFFAKKPQFSRVSFEIGFGFGDFLFAKAKNNPQQLFLGCEPHLNGVVAVLDKLEKEPLQNVKIATQDARQLLDLKESRGAAPSLSKNDISLQESIAQNTDNFFDEFYILFPDPWPKARHFKRRLINLDFLDNFLAPKLKKGAKLVIATDHDSYKTWILSAILQSQKFVWQCSSKQDWQTFPDDWIETKYQKKAANEGRVSVIFNLIRK